MKISPNRLAQQPPPLGRPLLAHKHAPNNVVPVQGNMVRQQQLAVPQPKVFPPKLASSVPVTQRHSPGITTRRAVEEDEHQTIDINLNINVNTGGSQEFKINMNGKQQPALPKPLSPSKPPVRGRVGNPVPVQVQRAIHPPQQLVSRGIPQRIPSPSRGLRIPSPQRGRMVAMPNATLLPKHSTIVSVPQQHIITQPVAPVSAVRVSRMPTSHEMQIQTDSFDQFEVKSQFWGPYQDTFDQELIRCVICHQTYDVRNTNNHVQRHRKSEVNFPQVPHSKLGYDGMREPQFRPIVEPEEFVMKPERNVYVVEKITRGGRSSFQNQELIGSGDIPTVTIAPASIVRPPPQVTEVTEVIQVVEDVHPSQIDAGGVMIGGTGHNRLYNQLAQVEQPTVVTTTTVVHQDPITQQVTEVHEIVQEPNQSIRMNPHTVVIDPLPQPVVVHEEVHVIDQPPIMPPIMPPPAHTILDNSGIVMPQPYTETSRFSQTIYDQQQQLYPTQQFIPQPQYMPQPIPSMVQQPMHQSTRIIIQQGEGVGGSRVIINQDVPTEHVNLFNQPTYQQPPGEMRFVESSIGGDAMHNSIGQYPQGPIMTSNFPGMGGSIVGAPIIPPPQIDPNTFGVNASQSSIHQMDHSVSSLAHPPMDVMIPPGRTMQQETTLVTQQNFMQPVQESRISNKSLRTIGGPGMVVQTTTEEVIQQPPIVLDSRIRQAELNSSFQQGVAAPPLLPAPIINSAYNPNPINSLPPPPGSFGPIVEQSRSALGTNGMFVSHLQPQGFPLPQNQQQESPTFPSQYNYNRAGSMQQSTPAQLTEAQRRVFQESQPQQRSRVPMNKLADWS